KSLLGEHDFSAFRAAGCQAKTPIKTMYQADISQQGPWFIFTFRANAFLHHMVRNMVGALVYVGAGRHQIADFHEIFTSRNRQNSAPTFAADGLYLSAIEYDTSFGLPADRLRLPFFIPNFPSACSHLKAKT
ncbi:MAG: hypothetical protein JNM52_05745, partial [Betaproteobacteria bacterium]|nr:hypothetical protein [Betaproteobacteria bacterium]